MEDALPRLRTDVGDDPVARQPCLLGDVPERAEEGGQQVAIGIGQVCG